MRLHRAILVVITTLFTAALPSIASAGCCDGGVAAPIAYSSWGGGCGGCGAYTYAQPIAPAPIVVGGCGGCGYSSAAAVFAAPVAVSAWGGGCCGRGIYAAPYVVEQGPVYSGLGLMVPYQTYSPAAAYAPAVEYPYVSGYPVGP